MARIAEQLSKGQVPDNLKQLFEFNCYLTAKRIMRLPKEKRKAAFDRMPEHAKPVIKKWALITNQYFTQKQNGASLNHDNNTKRS